MTDETATPSAEATEAVKESKPRQPRLTLTVNGETQPLLKFPFPVKAATFPVKINGEEAVAACTAGRGKAYTYLLYKNTSFYVPGTLPVESDCSVAFPENYKFDEVKQVRVSNYKPKKGKKDKEGNGNGEAVEAKEGSPEAQAEPSFVQPQPLEEHHQKISRRSRGASPV